MADLFGVEVVGLQELIVKLGGEADGGMQKRVTDAVIWETRQLEAQVRQNISTLFQNPSKMLDAISSSVEATSDTTTGTVIASGLPYLKALEYGVTTAAHDIFPVNAQVLAFMAPGKMGFSGGPKSSAMVFTKKVSHPGSVIPEFAYMRRSLAERKADIISSIQLAARIPE